MAKALIAMSGGVDSSAAALLMQKAGFECVGATMKLRENSGDFTEKSCCTADDAEDAGNVCAKLGIPFYVFNFVDEFREKVIAQFVHSYEIAETPNPCIECNRWLKFGKLFERADALMCDVIVTGHYARVEFDEQSGRWLLKKALNEAKDQSYVLYFLTQEQLARTRFPLGEFSDKEQVRALAKESGLLNASKHESQDICFVPDGNYAAFIENFSGKKYPDGDFVMSDGRVLGRHRGLIRYTIGQRKGLGISYSEPLFVLEKSTSDNTVKLGTEKELFSKELIARDFNWITYDTPPERPIKVTARTRYHSKEAEAEAFSNPDGTVTVRFSEPQRAISAGQAVVLYDGDTVVGGGVIS